MPLKRTKQLFKRLFGGNVVTLTHSDKSLPISAQAVHVPVSLLPIVITLGSGTDDDRTLLIRVMPNQGSQPSSSRVRIESLDVNDDITGFISLNCNETQILGNRDSLQAHLFEYPKQLPNKVLRITNKHETLLFKKLKKDQVVTVTKPAHHQLNRIIEQREKQAHSNGQRLNVIFDCYPQSLPKAQALSLLQSVNTRLKHDSDRPFNSSNQPGAVVNMPDDVTPIILGDLHARSENLLTLLTQEIYLDALEHSKTWLLILGDAVHPEAPQDLTQMENSVLTLDLILTLKEKFPNQVHYIRGNHDSFDSHVTKGGVPQGSLWEAHLKEVRGDDYVAELERYYRRLPYIVMARDFVACHAGPPITKGVSLQRLIDMDNDPSLIQQLTSTRLKGPHALTGYTRSDIAKFRKAMMMPVDFPFIVSHNPLGREDTLWFNATKIPGYHIVFSAHADQVGMIIRIRDRLVPQILTPYSKVELGKIWNQRVMREVTPPQ